MGEETNLKPPAARMRYTRLRRSIEDGTLIGTHGTPFQGGAEKIANAQRKRKTNRQNSDTCEDDPPSSRSGSRIKRDGNDENSLTEKAEYLTRNEDDRLTRADQLVKREESKNDALIQGTKETDNVSKDRTTIATLSGEGNGSIADGNGTASSDGCEDRTRLKREIDESDYRGRSPDIRASTVLSSFIKRDPVDPVDIK